MKSSIRERKIDRISLIWVGVVVVLQMGLVLLDLLAPGQDSTLFRWGSGLLVVLLVVAFNVYGQHYHKTLDERLQRRNDEATRVTFMLMVSVGVGYQMLNGVLDLKWPPVEVSITVMTAVLVYLLVYVIYWFRSR